MPTAAYPGVFPLSWSHYVQLMSVTTAPARAFYEAEAIRGGWSVRQLDRQISTQFYEWTSHSKRRAAMLAKGQVPLVPSWPLRARTAFLRRPANWSPWPRRRNMKVAGSVGGHRRGGVGACPANSDGFRGAEVPGDGAGGFCDIPPFTAHRAKCSNRRTDGIVGGYAARQNRVGEGPQAMVRLQPLARRQVFLHDRRPAANRMAVGKSTQSDADARRGKARSLAFPQAGGKRQVRPAALGGGAAGGC